MGRLVIASSHAVTPGDRKSGRLAEALWDELAKRGGVWFSWSGQISPQESRGVRILQEGNVDLALADVTAAEHEGYYLGYANGALWPVLHYRVDLARFDDTEFEVYGAVNRRFGRLLHQLLHRNDLVWVHDYQLLLIGQELRNSGWQGPLGFFLHTPFPAPEVLAALPQHQRLARGMAEFNLIGFQTTRDVSNFCRYMREHHAAELLSGGCLRVFGRVIRAEAFPSSIDPVEFRRLAESEEARTAAGRLRRIVGDRALVIGADTMDYSKGLPQRFLAFGRLLDEHTELRGRVNLLQIAPASSEALSAYQSLREELDRLSGRVNGDYSDLDWIPLRYLARSYSREVLAGLYRLARVGLVTPLHDGMSLVANEFVAAQVAADPGVLILSQFAGAAERMDAALLVNPHDVGGVADAISEAIAMSKEERIERWQALDTQTRNYDVTNWRRNFLDALETVGETTVNGPSC